MSIDGLDFIAKKKELLVVKGTLAAKALKISIMLFLLLRYIQKYFMVIVTIYYRKNY